MALTAVAPDLWSHVHRNRLPGGGSLQGRMNVVRLGDASTLVHSPTPVDDALAAQIAALGRVAYIVAPNCYHHLHVTAFLARFPDAKVYGAPGLAQKCPDLPLAGTLDDGAAVPWAGALDHITLPGAPKLNEVVFLHRASRSLLVTDLLFNVTSPDGWMAALMLRVMGTYKRFGPSRLLRWRLTKDRRALKAGVERMLAWDFVRVLPAHGDVFEASDPRLARERTRASLGWVVA
jgi:glyoxylase-like metal-dependent hydrolase (beta-lactamase superfamily II)